MHSLSQYWTVLESEFLLHATVNIFKNKVVIITTAAAAVIIIISIGICFLEAQILSMLGNNL